MDEQAKREKKARRKEKRKQKARRKRARDAAKRAELREYWKARDEFQTGYSKSSLVRAAHHTNVRRPFSGGSPGSGRRA